MALLSVIRRWHFREGVSIREISRCTHLSRNTIRKYLNSEELEPTYPKRIGPSKLDPFVGILASWFTREAGRGHKHQRNLKQLYGDLVALGYRGSYDRITAYARAWRFTAAGSRAHRPGTFCTVSLRPR